MSIPYTSVWQAKVGRYGLVESQAPLTEFQIDSFPHVVIPVSFEGMKGNWIATRGEVDSIPGYSPVRIRRDGWTDIVELEDLWNEQGSEIIRLNTGEEIRDAWNVYAFGAQL